MRRSYLTLLAAVGISVVNVGWVVGQEPPIAPPPPDLPAVPALPPTPTIAQPTIPPPPPDAAPLPVIPVTDEPPLAPPPAQPDNILPVAAPPCADGRCSLPLYTLPEPGAVPLPSLTLPESVPETGAPEMPAGPGAYDTLVGMTGAPCGPCAQKPPPPPPPPFGGPLHERQKLLGDWRGARNHLRDHGFNFDIYSTNFGSNIANGGLQ